MSVSLPVGTTEIYSVLNCKVWLKDLNGLRVSFTEEVEPQEVILLQVADTPVTKSGWVL